MSTYVIGDIHGCFDQLQQLLGLIKFDHHHDILWFTGDLVNGGPKPAETIRFIMSLGDRHICILGNHDLVLMSIAVGAMSQPLDRAIGFEPVLNAPDCDAIIAWLKQRPILHYDPQFNAVLVHAGILPNWNLSQAQQCAREIENVLRGPQANELFHEMYGNLPDTWDEHLSGWPRIRFLINTFTRMRFCTADGKLELLAKGNMENAPPGFQPWFKIPQRRTANVTILFGHWAALVGKTDIANVIAMDTGCVWGNSLTALRLEDGQRFSVASDINAQ